MRVSEGNNLSAIRGVSNYFLIACHGGIENKALSEAKGFEGLKGMDLAKVVTQPAKGWTQSRWSINDGYAQQIETKFKVVAYDFGIKNNILRLLAEKGCDLSIVPAQTPADEVLKLKPDGIFLSNGPGDPEPVSYTHLTLPTNREV